MFSFLKTCFGWFAWYWFVFLNSVLCCFVVVICVYLFRLFSIVEFLASSQNHNKYSRFLKLETNMSANVFLVCLLFAFFTQSVVFFVGLTSIDLFWSILSFVFLFLFVCNSFGCLDKFSPLCGFVVICTVLSRFVSIVASSQTPAQNHNKHTKCLRQNHNTVFR